MSDVKNTGVLNSHNSDNRMQSQHTHQSNQTIHIEQSKENRSLNRIEEKIHKIDNELSNLNKTHSVTNLRLYSDNDNTSHHSSIKLGIETKEMNHSEYQRFKHDNRGILHKIDTHFKVDIGDGKIGNAVWTAMLNEEAGVFRYADAAKNFITHSSASQNAKYAVRGRVEQAGRDNTAINAALKTSFATAALGREVARYNREMRSYKPVLLENKRNRLAAKAEKIKMKAATKESKDLLNSGAFGLSPSIVNDSNVKSSWQRIYSGADDRNYSRPPQKKKRDKNSYSKLEYKHQRRMDKLEQKEFNADKKAYSNVKVKERYIDTETGRTKTQTVTMVDKSHLKQPKVRKPSSLGGRVALVGLSELRYKAFNAISQDDNAAVQAAGKGASLAFSEFSRAHQASLARKDKLFEKRVNNARMKAEKTHSKLEVEKSKNNFAEKSTKKANQKKRQKKLAQKKRNSQMYAKIQAAAQQAKSTIAIKAKEIIAGKGKYVALAGCGFFALMVIPMLFILLLGGGGNTITNTATIETATYLTDRAGLVKFNEDVNKLVWDWQQNINSSMNSIASGNTSEWQWKVYPCEGGPTTNCPDMESKPYIKNGDSVLHIKQLLYGGEKCNLSYYDMMSLYAYFTVKYRDGDWASASSELGHIYSQYYTLQQRPEGVVVDKNEKLLIDNHTNISCTIEEVTETITVPSDDDKKEEGNADENESGDGDSDDGDSDDGGSKTVTVTKKVHHHNPESDPHEESATDFKAYYYLYPSDPYVEDPIQSYIAEQIAQIGEITDNGMSEGQLHYEFLMKSLGYHQCIDYAVYDANTHEKIDWSNSSRQFGTCGVLYDKNEGAEGKLPDFRYTQETNNSAYVVGSCSALQAVAGGDGIIKSKSAGTIEIEYPEDNLIITYKAMQTGTEEDTYVDGSIGNVTTLNPGATVIAGTHLFNVYSNSLSQPVVQLTAYCTETQSYINPLLVIRSREYN